MGEAKRRRTAYLNEPCPCGSMKPAATCCYDGRRWRKAPALLGLRDLPPGSVNEKCYMRELRSCGGGISGEHLVSESVIHLLKADGDLTVSGFPWLEDGETKTIGPRSLTANCLCRTHNSALSPLDDAALFFFTTLKSCLDRKANSVRYLLSGHDIERWLLKTLKAMAVSGNLKHGGQRLTGAFSSDIQVLDMLDNPSHWPDGTGLYCMMGTGRLTKTQNSFQLTPLMNSQGKLSGLRANIMGLSFTLMLQPPIMSENPELAKADFRPIQIVITYPGATNWIFLSWDDGKALTNTVGLVFVREIDPPNPIKPRPAV